jgi:hypothetical protein
MRNTNVSALYAAYPHLKRIEELWGSREGREFINKLMNDTRGGIRHGFPPEHATTILRLLMEHDRRFPQFEESISVLWREPDASRRGEKT